MIFKISDFILYYKNQYEDLTRYLEYAILGIERWGTDCYLKNID